ncbi:MAG: DUF29 domain-containing protein, partial [Crocosphaera sp.]
FLKLAYWETERDYNQAGWKREIRNFRIQIKRLLKDSPSLKPYLTEIIEECYQDSVNLSSDNMKLSTIMFPNHTIANLEQILDEDWLPI